MVSSDGKSFFDPIHRYGQYPNESNPLYFKYLNEACWNVYGP